MPRRHAATVLLCLVVAACSRPLPDGWRYVTRVSSTAATVVWTGGSTQATCRRADGERRDATAADGSPRSVRLEGLTPGARYRCWLGSSGGRAHVRFRTAPVRGQPVRLAVVGDTGDGSPAAAALARRIAAGHPDLLVHLGDLNYLGRKPGALDRAFFRPYRRVLARVPLLPTPGNHDLGRRSLYRTVFGPAADLDEGGPCSVADWGDARLAVVTSMAVAGGGRSQRWIDDAFGGQPDVVWRLLVLHEPPYYPGRKWVTRGLRATLDAVLASPHAPDLLLAGHVHLYARAVPLCTATPERPALELISGGGGANLDPAARQGNFPVVVSATHYLRVTITPDAVRVRAVAVDGRVLDHVRLGGGATPACRREGWPQPNERAR